MYSLERETRAAMQLDLAEWVPTLLLVTGFTALAQRPDVKQAMIESDSRMAIMAHDEFTTDIPGHAHLSPKDFWNRRARGLGGSETDPICSCGEENLLGFPGDPYSTENILIHEFAHNIHLRGLGVAHGRDDAGLDDA